jgi:hypothetical protein
MHRDLPKHTRPIRFWLYLLVWAFTTALIYLAHLGGIQHDSLKHHLTCALFLSVATGLACFSLLVLIWLWTVDDRLSSKVLGVICAAILGLVAAGLGFFWFLGIHMAP